MRQEWISSNQKLINNDCLEEMKLMPEKSVDVVVTSPPYNISVDYKTYKDNVAYEEYLSWMEKVIFGIKVILKNDGSFFLNIGSSCKNPYTPFDICHIAKKLDFALQNNIVWVKAITVNETNYGHFKPINTSERLLNRLHESLFHFTKNGDVKLDRLAIGCPYSDKFNTKRWNVKGDLRCRGNVWFLPYNTVGGRGEHKTKDHPASFPVALPEMCIKLHGIKENMVVCDPFLGAGTTLVACRNLNVNGIGIELDKTYCEWTLQKI